MSWRRKTFEVLPALSVRGESLRAALRTVTIAWMFGIVWMACVSGSQMTLFCRMLGFSDYDFGILAAIDAADEQLMRIRDLVETGDAAGIERYLAAAKKRRDALLAQRLRHEE